MSEADALDQCSCNHPRGKHARGRCTGRDSYGFRCECRSFFLDTNDEQSDGDPGIDPNDFIQLRSVAREDEILYGQQCAAVYDQRSR